MAVSFPRGGGKTVPRDILRYINRVADALAESTNRELDSVMGTGGSSLTVVSSASELPTDPQQGDLIYVTTAFAAFQQAIYVRSGSNWVIGASTGAVTNVNGWNGTVALTSGAIFRQAANGGAWPTSAPLVGMVTFRNGSMTESAEITANINATGQITATVTSTNAEIQVVFRGTNTSAVTVEATHTSGAGYTFEFLALGTATPGTDGVAGLPAVASNYPYDRRIGSGDPTSGQYLLLNSGGTSLSPGDAWSTITDITVSNEDDNSQDVSTTINAFVNNGTHVRIFRTNSEWGWFLITDTTAVSGGVRIGVSFIDGRGVVNSPTTANQQVFIGFDIAVGTQGDAALAANLTISPDTVSQQTNGEYPATLAAISVVFAAGNTVLAPISIGNLVVTSAGNVTAPVPVSNTQITIGGNTYQYDIVYSNNNRTVTVRLETTSGDLIATESHSLGLLSRGEQGQNGQTFTRFFADRATGGNISETRGATQRFFNDVVHTVGEMPTTPTTDFVAFISPDPLVVNVTPETVNLEANYRGVVGTVNRMVNISVSRGDTNYTYDDSSPFTDDTFRIANVVEGSASVTNNADGTLSVTGTTADIQSVTFDVIATDENGTFTTPRSVEVVRNNAERPVPEVELAPTALTLNANYLGAVTPVNETITASVVFGATTFTYDTTDAGTANTFVITSVTDGAASVTNNNDGTLSLTDINDDADSQTVTVNIRYYDAAGQVYNVQRFLTVLKVTAQRTIPTPDVTRRLVTLQANYLGVVDTGQSENVTVTLPNYTYDAAGEIANDGFRVSVNAAGGASVTNNNDGTVSITNLPNNQSSATVTLQVDYRDDIGQLYSQTFDIEVIKNVPSREIPTAAASRNVVTLEANHLGVVASSQSESVTFTVPGFTYDAAGEIANSGFRISVSSDGGASITNNNDGTISITNLPTNQATATVAVTVQYRTSAGQLFSQTVNVEVVKNEAAAPVVNSSIQPETFVYQADNMGMTTSQPQTATIIVEEGGTPLAYTTNTTLTPNQWRVTGIVTGGSIGVTNNNDGTFTVNNPSNTLDSGSFTINIAYQNDVGTNSTRSFVGRWSKANVVGADGTPGFTGRVSFAGSPTFVQNADASWPTTSSSVATITFTDGSTTVDETYTVTVNSSGVLSGTVSNSDASITLSTTTTTGILVATWTHSSGASITQTFIASSLAPRSEIVTIYLTAPQATAPANPTFTGYNFTTGVTSGRTTGWQDTPVNLTVTSTSDLYWSQEFQVTEMMYGGALTITRRGTPTSSINFGNDIQSDNFVAGSAGWQIQRDTGNAEFDNVTIRGDSIIDGGTIGVPTTQSLVMDTFNSPEGGSGPTNNAYTLDITNAARVNSFSTEFSFFSPTPAEPTVTSVTVGLTVRVRDGSSVISTTTHTLTQDNIVWENTPRTNSFSSRFSSTEVLTLDINQATTSSTATRVEIDVTSISNGILIAYNSTVFGALLAEPRISADIDVPSDASSYFATSNLAETAITVEGGRGLRTIPQLLFSGSSTSATLPRDRHDTFLYSDNIFLVNVSFDTSDTVNSTNALVASAVLGVHFENVIGIGAGGSARTISTSADLYEYENNKYIGRLTISAPPFSTFGATISLRTNDADAAISNQRIREVWRKMS